MKSSIYKHLKFALVLIISFLGLPQVFAQLGSSDVTVNVDYANGTLTVSWKDDPGGSNLCRTYSDQEKVVISYAGNTRTIFDNTVGGSSSAGSVTVYASNGTLPLEFLTNTGTVTWSGRHGNARASCTNPMIPSTIPKQVSTKIDNPGSLTAGFDASCSGVYLSWTKPSIVSTSPNLYFDIARRQANTTGGWTTVINGLNGTSFNDVNAAPGIEQEYRVQATMGYGGNKAITSGSNVNGRRIGVNGTPSGLYIDQSNCNGDLQVNWNWPNSDNPDNFEITKSTSSTFASGNSTITLSGSDRTYRDNNVTSGTEYFYRVRAAAQCPGSSTGVYSAYTSTESQVGLGAPVATVTSRISVDTVNREVTLDWVDNSLMEEGFKVVRQGPTGQVEFDVAENDTTFTDNSAAICENLTYKVKVYNSCRSTGVISTNQQNAYIPADISSVFNTTNNKVEATDGEFGDRIELKWKTPTRQVDDWEIYRINPLIPDTTFVASVQGNGRFYSDNSANANTLYNYRIIGVSNCAGNILYSNSTQDIGFRLAFGTVNGQITYDGGTAVEGVKVTAQAASGASGKSGHFNGTSAYADAGNPDDLKADSMTIMSFIRPTDLTGKQVIASKRTGTNGWEFFLDGSSLKLTAGSTTITGTSPFIIAGNWFSVGASVSGDSLKLYVNGKLIQGLASTTLAKDTVSNFLIGKNSAGNFFDGQFDDMRFYNRAISNVEVARSFDVYINPSMDGLVGYWRFDEGFGNRAYDYSKTLLTPNKNHVSLVGATFSNSKPSTTQLTAGAYTDDRGSYFIPFIPYLGNGDNYILTPSFGTHRFTPATTTLYIGGSNPNFSNVDFTDNSAFTVTGSVKFANSSCFVEDVFIKVDGEVVIQNGEPVKTDANGVYSLQVPIGPHVITAEKLGHTFSVGRFPSSGNYNFQQNEALNSFIDNTLMKVVGRVAGGGIQKALPPGLGRGTNNIGRATIRFTSQQGGGCMDTTVTTDASTGEYEIMLPPIKFNVPDFTISSNASIAFRNNPILDLSAAPPSQVETDTLFRDSAGVKKVDRIDTIRFNKINDYIHFVAPTLSVVDYNLGTNYGSDTVEISVRDSSINIPTSVLGLKYPIFEENDVYEWNILANEIYENKDGGNSVFDSVPMTDGKIVINNALASEVSKEYTIRPQDNFSGTQNYKFTAGQANTATNQTIPDYSFTKTCEVTLITPNSTVIWRPNAGDGTPSPLFRGVIFGGRALGNSFATAGPQVVTMILRDPPGSNSSASWEKETTHTTVSTYENGGGLGVQLQKNIKLGTEFTIGLGYSTKTKISNNLISNTKIETSISESNEVVESTSNSIAIATSSDPEFVGPDADLFFGRSLNMDFGLSQIITLIDTSQCGNGNSECYGSVFSYNGKGYKIGSTKAMFAIPGGYGTEFVFTQLGIESSVIPRLEALRNQLLATHGDYLSKLPVSDANYGKSNDDPVFGANAKPDPEKNTTSDGDGQSYTYSGYASKDTTVTNSLGVSKTVRITTGVDSVWWYNKQIKLWQDAIARNEKEKVNANSSNQDRNISYQAGASVTYTNSSSREETTNMTINFNLEEDLALKIGAEIGGVGVEVEQHLAMNYSHSTSKSTTTSTTTTFSYTIDDPDAGDDFTVDVFNSKDGYGPIFKTRGGQTACPYQGETKTKYYRPGTTIDKATIQLEQPRITASPTTVYNVPADGTANITLNLINDGLEDQVYDLKVLETSNPFGAILKIDGITPNRSFAVPAGTSIVKQLQVQKGPNHIKYDSLAFVFHSQCQYAFGTANYEDIADTVYISVNFLPACTQPNISNPGNQFVLNNSFNDTLPLVIDGYDINYGGFEKVWLQYKPSAESSWNTLSETWFVDTNNLSTRYPNHPAPLALPTNQAYILYDFDMEQLIDQNYQIRAVTTCKIPGNPDKDEFSNIIEGVADRVNPHPFGTPSPADGVLDPNDDISIQFNEPIEAGALTVDNFKITGVVNGQPLRHDKTVLFDGASGYLEVQNGFDFAAGSFTVEFWAKRNTLGTKQTVVSQGGAANNFFSIGFNSSNQVEVQIGNATYASSFTVLDDTTWHHYSVIYDKPGLNLDIVDRSSSNTVSSTNNNFLGNYTSGGKTFFGKSSLTGGDYFDGSAHQIRIWNRALTSSIIASRLDRTLTGREPGLVGYWPMEEGRGNLAEDVARARNAQMFAQWELAPKSSSAFFDGVDDYAVLDSAGTLAASFEMDLTFEFWFKTAGGRTQTFLSNGGGRFLPNDVNRNGWNIEMASDNTIHVKNDSTDFVAVSNDFADNRWHHFAFVLNRLSGATAYIDGQQQNTADAAGFYGFGAPKLAIGARFSTNGVNDTYDQYFSGNIDEVRIWNSARLKDNLDLSMFNRLQGDEFGLMAYYPFEEYKVELGVPKLTASYKDASPALLHILPKNGNTISATESPAIALPKPVKNINFTWSVNNDKIVINTNEPNENIENVTLDISVKNVKDLRGNKMQSPKTWIAFINKNQVLWQDVEKNLNKEFNDTMTFSTRVVNNGGQVKTFNIKNLPSWLTASRTAGSIDPQTTQRITFTVNPAINIGDYSADLLLSTDFGYDEKLVVNLKVRKSAPDFSFNSAQYAKSMSIIGQISINGIISTNEEDLLVAYKGEQIRGVAQLDYMPSLDKYVAFLDIYSNTTSDSITFKVWNSKEGELHEDVTPEIVFVDNGLIGTVLQPQVFEAVDKLAKPIALDRGWNWVSFPLHDDKMRSFDVFMRGLNFSEGDQVKTIGNNTFATYGSSTGWSGNLVRDGLNNINSYMIHISSPDTIEYSGFVIDPDTLPIQTVSGWNRIGFISPKNIEVNTAMANYNPTNGDILKSQRSFAVYQSGLGWVGSLRALESTEGYLLKSAQGDTFVYPRSGLFRMKAEAEQANPNYNIIAGNPLNPSDFEANSNLIIQLNTCDEIIENDEWVLLAMKAGKLRGVSHKSVKLDSMEKAAYYLTVYGESGDKFDFFVYNQNTKELLKAAGKIDFEKDKLQGRPMEPIQMELEIKQDCERFAPVSPVLANTEDGLAYPNPFTNFLTIQIPQGTEANDVVRIIDVYGKTMFETTAGDKENIHLNGSVIHNWSSGVYYLEFIGKEVDKVEKLIKLK